MSQFHTRLAMEAADDSDTGRWMLTQALIYSSDVAQMTIVVPRGFHTDLATVPRIPFVYTLIGGRADAAATLHDYLYSTGMVARSMADKVMREAAEATGVPWFQRWAMWAGVRIGGAANFLPT